MRRCQSASARLGVHQANSSRHQYGVHCLRTQWQPAVANKNKATIVLSLLCWVQWTCITQRACGALGLYRERAALLPVCGGADGAATVQAEAGGAVEARASRSWKVGPLHCEGKGGPCIAKGPAGHQLCHYLPVTAAAQQMSPWSCCRVGRPQVHAVAGHI